MSKRLKGCLIGAVVIYAIFAAILIIVKLTTVQDLHSAPSLSRDTPAFNSGSMGLLEEASRKVIQVRPASEPMDYPLIHKGAKGSYVLEWANEDIVGKGTPPDPWVTGLDGDDEIELVGFATWFPQPEDSVEEDWNIGLRFWDPISLEEIPAEKLDSMGVPKSMQTMDPPREYHTPKIRLLFRNRNMEYVRFTGINIGDAKTDAQVSYDIERLREQDSRFQSQENWSCLDSAILIWHDSPLTCRVSVLTGEPQTGTLPRKIGEQTAFDENIRVQWIAEEEMNVDIDWRLTSFEPDPSLSHKDADALIEKYERMSGQNARAFFVKPDEDDDIEPRILIRSSSETILKNHTGVITPNGPSWDWVEEEDEGGFYFASKKDPAPDSDSVTLVYLPHITELEFSITGIPNTPNPGPLEDLFDITLPRITLSDDLDDAETYLIGFLSVATQVEWDSSDLWGDSPPTNFPDDYTFRNETPQSLLNWYLANTKGAFFRYDEEQFAIYVNTAEEKWWDQLIKKFRFWSLFP